MAKTSRPCSPAIRAVISEPPDQREVLELAEVGDAERAIGRRRGERGRQRREPGAADGLRDRPLGRDDEEPVGALRDHEQLPEPLAPAIGASYAGDLGATTTSGPGLALKGEAIGLAVMLELPLVIVDVQRGGPSTGLPTKTEQADLLQAVHGRNGEAPLCVIAAATPADCFAATYEACRIAIKYMTPVICLTDGYLGNGAEPWLIPDVKDLPEIPVTFAREQATFHPYQRDEKTLARPWAIPGTPGLEHRIGGLEKQHITGNISYDPDNHDFMVKMRAAKIERIVDDIPLQTIEGDQEGDLLVVGWGGGVLLREEFDEDLLQKELDEFGLSGSITRVTNPWYYRKKNTDTWVKIGEI